MSQNTGWLDSPYHPSLPRHNAIQQRTQNLVPATSKLAPALRPAGPQNQRPWAIALPTTWWKPVLGLPQPHSQPLWFDPTNQWAKIGPGPSPPHQLAHTCRSQSERTQGLGSTRFLVPPIESLQRPWNQVSFNSWGRGASYPWKYAPPTSRRP